MDQHPALYENAENSEQINDQSMLHNKAHFKILQVKSYL